MKVLLLNPKLPHSFWNLEQTASMTNKKAVAPPLGLITVAALLPRQWQLRLVDRNVSEISGALWDWSDLVMLSCMWPQKEDALALIREAKLKGKPVAVGGPYPTVLPEELVDAGADYVFQGEGEATVPLFIAALAEGRSKGVFTGKDKPDLDSSPPPRFDLLDARAYITMAVQTTRGCPFNCEFCDVVKLNGRKPRHKRPEHVTRELEALRSIGGIDEVFIADDNLIGDRAYALDLMSQVARWSKSHGEPFRFWTQASINLGKDKELMDVLTHANLSYVIVGVESPDTEALLCAKKIHNTQVSLDDALQSINRNGLCTIPSFIMGLDGEREGLGGRIVEFVERNNIPLVVINPLHVLPNTTLWHRLKEQNRLLESDTRPYEYDCKLNYVPTRPESEIRREYLEAIDRLYEPQAYLKRANRYFLNMRPTRKALGVTETFTPERVRSSSRKPLRKQVIGLKDFVKLTWRQGIKASYRSQFWTQLLDVWQRNPSRLIGYLGSCGLGENVFSYRQTIISGSRARP